MITGIFEFCKKKDKKSVGPKISTKYDLNLTKCFLKVQFILLFFCKKIIIFVKQS